jgi:hypothetical protein
MTEIYQLQLEILKVVQDLEEGTKKKKAKQGGKKTSYFNKTLFVCKNQNTLDVYNVNVMVGEADIIPHYPR